jgi:hypothetical protein
VVLVPEAVQARLNLLNANLPVFRGEREQLASGEIFGRSAFVHVDVRELRAENGVKGRGHGLEAEDVRARAAEDEEDFYLFAEMAAKEGDRIPRERVVPVCHDVPRIDGRDCLYHSRVDPRIVIAGEASPLCHTHF